MVSPSDNTTPSGTYPASEPPTQAIMLGENAGALPEFAPAVVDAGGGGDGLFRMAMCGVRERSERYRSYGGGGLPSSPDCDDDERGDIARMSSVCSRGMKPGSARVPPTHKMVEAIIFRRSTGTWDVDYKQKGGDK